MATMRQVDVFKHHRPLQTIGYASAADEGLALKLQVFKTSAGELTRTHEPLLSPQRFSHDMFASAWLKFRSKRAGKFASIQVI